MPSHERATCGGCGLVCDDITALVFRRRRRARAPRADLPAGRRLVRRADRCQPAGRSRRRGARPNSRAALDQAAAILTDARSPLVYGLGRATCEAQRSAVALGATLGAAIDPAGPLLDGASGLAFQARGASTATLGDVRDRANVVVVWRADPVTTHPRLFERLRLPDPSRPLIVVDERRTATAAGGRHLPRASRRIATSTHCGRCGRSSASAPVAAEPPLEDLAARLRGFRSVAILHHVPGHLAALGLHALVRDLCQGHACRRRDAPPREQCRGRRGRARLADRVTRRP